jgi:enolase
LPGKLDRRLLELDGTADKSRLGANALLAVSLAFARAAAAQARIELFNYFASLLPEPSPVLPALTINLFSGGKHAFGQVADRLAKYNRLLQLEHQYTMEFNV